MTEAALPTAGPTLAPTNKAAEKSAATAAARLLDTFENILISFRFETVFRNLAKIFLALHSPCQFQFYTIFPIVRKFSSIPLIPMKPIFSGFYQFLAFRE